MEGELTVDLEVGQVWKARTRTKTITDVQPGVRVGYIDSSDGKEWYQQWGTFRTWIEIANAAMEGELRG
jgi:hypothetical protein